MHIFYMYHIMYTCINKSSVKIKDVKLYKKNHRNELNSECRTIKGIE